MNFLEYHKKQWNIVWKFKEVSSTNFDNCCGVIDGLLVCILKPNIKDVVVSKVGVKKFFCRHKKNLDWTCKRYITLKAGI